MSATIGRLLQLVGLIMLPIGFAYGMSKGDIRTEVQLLFVGGMLFLTGWILSRERR